MRFKIRASAGGHIMGGDIGLSDSQQIEYDKLSTKEKRLTEKQAVTLKSLELKKGNPELPKGAKTYCKDWLKGQLYNRRKEIHSKYLNKGHDVEDESIEYIAQQLGYGMLFKNSKQFSNDFMQGEPDVLMSDTIIDAKNSWDFTTFPLFETEIPNMDYYWQGQIYMELTGKRKYRIVYTLIDTPEYLIEREFSSYCWANNIEQDQDIYDEFVARMTYPDIPDHLKIKCFDFEYNEQDVKDIYTRVEMCRDYIVELSKNIK